MVTDICGDSVVTGVEECDDGNVYSNDGCSRVCTIGHFCVVRVRVRVLSLGVFGCPFASDFFVYI